MRRTVRQWIVAVGVGAAALAAGVSSAAPGLAGAAGAPATATVVQAGDGCTTSDCGGNHNQVLV